MRGRKPRLGALQEAGAVREALVEAQHLPQDLAVAEVHERGTVYAVVRGGQNRGRRELFSPCVRALTNLAADLQLVRDGDGRVALPKRHVVPSGVGDHPQGGLGDPRLTQDRVSHQDAARPINCQRRLVGRQRSRRPVRVAAV